MGKRDDNIQQSYGQTRLYQVSGSVQMGLAMVYITLGPTSPSWGRGEGRLTAPLAAMWQAHTTNNRTVEGSASQQGGGDWR